LADTSIFPPVIFIPVVGFGCPVPVANIPTLFEIISTVPLDISILPHA